MSLYSDFKELPKIWKEAGLGVKIFIFISAFLATTPLISLSESIIKWRHFFADILIFYDGIKSHFEIYFRWLEENITFVSFPVWYFDYFVILYIFYTWFAAADGMFRNGYPWYWMLHLLFNLIVVTVSAWALIIVALILIHHASYLHFILTRRKGVPPTDYEFLELIDNLCEQEGIREYERTNTPVIVDYDHIVKKNEDFLKQYLKNKNAPIMELEPALHFHNKWKIKDEFRKIRLLMFFGSIGITLLIFIIIVSINSAFSVSINTP